jgi:hypothetical protein
MQQMDGENFARLRFGGWLLEDGMALLAAVFLGVLGLIIGEPLILLLLARVSGAIFCMEGGGTKMYASV